MSGEFEGKSLDALYAMIASAKPEDLSGAGQALAAAAPKILSIASDLRHYISRVEWEGEGGNAFREWGAGMVRETLVLGDFTKVVADEMRTAAQALTEAKASFPKPAGMCFADPEKEKARIEAETGPKLQEGIDVLRRLSSFYESTGNQMQAQRTPDFKPMTESGVIGEREYGVGNGTGSGTYAGSGTGSGSGTTQTGHTTLARAEVSTPNDTGRRIPDPVNPPSTPPPVAPARPDSEVDTNLDSVTLTPPPETTNRPPAQPPLTTTPPPATNQPLPPVSLPPVAPPMAQQNGGQQSRLPVTGLPSQAPRTGLPGPSTLGPMGRVEGITGGKQVPGRPVTGQPMGRMPMSTVVGEERAAQYGRGATGMHGPGGVGPHGGPMGGQNGAGRRLATQPGGTIGAPSTSGVSGRPAFTPGGTGLVRPPASTQQEGEERRTPRNRPDYLSEDEETWTSGQRQIVPPVIG
ncbi:hypothetical protein [Streptomyces roseicoloratus]|uniref:hypothetical protein n=1 Tax=Streptomyces roseicoloratus TaxID=2508722 RepID=UPI0010099469|nr:hypothetical protein [Streptomyces roseicoloratus]